MTIYSAHNLKCEYCECDLIVSTEVIKTDDGLFCTDECVSNHFNDMYNIHTVTLTDDEMYKDVEVNE